MDENALPPQRFITSPSNTPNKQKKKERAETLRDYTGGSTNLLVEPFTRGHHPIPETHFPSGVPQNSHLDEYGEHIDQESLNMTTEKQAINIPRLDVSESEEEGSDSLFGSEEGQNVHRKQKHRGIRLEGDGKRLQSWMDDLLPRAPIHDRAEVTLTQAIHDEEGRDASYQLNSSATNKEYPKKQESRQRGERNVADYTKDKQCREMMKEYATNLSSIIQGVKAQLQSTENSHVVCESMIIQIEVTLRLYERKEFLTADEVAQFMRDTVATILITGKALFKPASRFPHEDNINVQGDSLENNYPSSSLATSSSRFHDPRYDEGQVRASMGYEGDYDDHSRRNGRPQVSQITTEKKPNRGSGKKPEKNHKQGVTGGSKFNPQNQEETEPSSIHSREKHAQNGRPKEARSQVKIDPSRSILPQGGQQTTKFVHSNNVFSQKPNSQNSETNEEGCVVQ